MGKASMFIMIGALVAGGIILYQSELTTFETLVDQSERQEEIVAREIARSGFSHILARVRDVERELYAFNPSTPLTQVVQAVNDGTDNKLEYDYEGGQYRIWMEIVGLDAYRLNSTGMFGKAEHTIRGSFVPANISNTPENNDPLGAAIVEDFDEFGDDCAAIYMQRFIPITDAGGNSDGSSDGDLLGPDYEQRFARYYRTDPDMIFSSGNGRDFHLANIHTELPAGTRIGFILGVDEGCTLEDQDEPNIEDFDHRYYSLVAHRSGSGGGSGTPRAGGAGAVGELVEGNNALVEQNANYDWVWRIRFEANSDWTAEELQDAKEALSEATKDTDGYAPLESDPDNPDFTDFVFEFWMNDDYAYEMAQHAPGDQETTEVDLYGDE